MKYFIATLFLITISFHLRSKTIDSLIVIRGDTFQCTVLKTFFRHSVINDSIIRIMESSPEGKNCIVDTNYVIRYLYTIKNKRIVDSAFSYSSNQKLIGFSTFRNGKRHKAYNVDENHCIFQYTEWPDSINYNYVVILAFDQCRDVKQIVILDGMIISKTSTNRRRLKKLTALMQFKFDQYYYPKSNEYYFIKK